MKATDHDLLNALRELALDDLMAMSDQELRAEIAADGEDITALAAQSKAVMESAVRQFSFAAVLREARERAGLSLEELGRRTGLVPEYLAQLEECARLQNWEEAIQPLAVALEMAPQAFFRTISRAR